MSKKRKRRKVPAIEEPIPKKVEAVDEEPQEESEDESYQGDPPAGCLLRLFWMMVGNAILLLCLFQITQKPSGTFGTFDIVYGLGILSLLAARYLDIRYFNGTTVDDQPATLTHWCRYAAILLAISILLWGAAHLLAYIFA